MPTIRAVRRRHSQVWAARSGDFILAAAGRIAEQSSLRWAAYELVRFHRAAFAELDDGILVELAVGLDSWDSVDAFARTLSGPAWVRGLIGDDLIHAWTASSDRWLRRAALVSTVALNRPADGGGADAPRTLAVCDRLVGDRDDMVVKALSWALRELGRRDPVPVQAFLRRHGTRLAARVRREVGQKLSTGLKNPRRRPA